MQGRMALVALAIVGCSEPAPATVAEPAQAEAMAPVEAPAPPVEVDPAREAQLRSVEGWLSGCAVGDAGLAERKLYTWTRAEQIEELRPPRRALLSRARAAGGEPSLFDQALEDDEHPVARRLRRGSRTRRFAWVSPWPTRMGWEEGDYGDRLIEIALRDDTWVARFEPGAEPRWRVFDAEGAEVPEDRVARSPGRVGAVFHVGDGPRAFREVVLVDEQRIARWAYATEAIRDRVRADAARLRELAALWRDAPPDPVPDLDAWLRAGWRAEPETLAERWRACLALGSEEYALSAAHADAVAAALEAMPPDEAIEREVRVVYPGVPSVSSTGWCDPTMLGCPP